ncbi:MAG: hypothetical protein KKA65_04015 [Nanoarchaeota archaeon]|nr:hypothetical protein [Nanoarchaeota archaeon]MBU4242122.1 hypothetical protein [Nanoarchaeota archaeon]MBU4352240.1 hypothetical protein [Nanoarchaeota archaeon]MBU4456643.1 hypothetical protein [Nanoarchaeota archaeon]MCG2719197.1 hypothetical protein [Nanoarchaeota archaeon]
MNKRSLANKVQEIELNYDSFVKVEGYSPLVKKEDKKDDSNNIIIKEIYKVLNGPQEEGQRTFDVEFTVRNKNTRSLTEEELKEIYLKVKEDLFRKGIDDKFNFDYFVAMTSGKQYKVYRDGKRMLGIKEITHPRVLELLRTLPKYVQDWIEDLNE